MSSRVAIFFVVVTTASAYNATTHVKLCCGHDCVTMPAVASQGSFLLRSEEGMALSHDERAFRTAALTQKEVTIVPQQLTKGFLYQVNGGDFKAVASLSPWVNACRNATFVESGMNATNNSTMTSLPDASGNNETTVEMDNFTNTIPVEAKLFRNETEATDATLGYAGNVTQRENVADSFAPFSFSAKVIRQGEVIDTLCNNTLGNNTSSFDRNIDVVASAILSGMQKPATCPVKAVHKKTALKREVERVAEASKAMVSPLDEEMLFSVDDNGTPVLGGDGACNG